MQMATVSYLPGRAQRLVAPGMVLAVLAGAVAALVLLYLAHLRTQEREFLTWQVRTSAVAERQATAVTSWCARRFAALRVLADNASLQIYLTELTQGTHDAIEAAAQRQYLAQLFALTATRNGFADDDRAAAALIDENATARAGIALLTSGMRPIIATSGMAALVTALGDRFATQPPPTQRTLVDALALADNSLAVGFVEPVYAVDSDSATSNIVGYVAGVAPMDAELFAMLTIDAPYPASASTLVRVADGMVEYLSPDPGASKPPRRRVSAATGSLDVVFAASEPGAFAEKRDFRGVPVLTTGRSIAGTPWIVVHSVPVEAAMAESDARARYVALIIALAALLAIAAVVIVARYAASRRLTDLAAEHKRLKEHYESEHERLELISDMQPDILLVVDADGAVRYANRAFCLRLGLARQAVLGKGLDALLGSASAEPLLKASARAAATASAVDETIAGEGHTLQLIVLPLAEADVPGAVLIVQRDITELMARRDLREHHLSQLVAALTSAVDLHHANTAQQSAQVAALARGIGAQLQLDRATADATEMAGRLMNFGKILVPQDILVRNGPLSADELGLIRKSLAEMAWLLSGTDCDERLAEALDDIADRWNGRGLGDEPGARMSLAAQIAAAANFFVAAASTRGYRAKRGIGYAMAELQREGGKSFDRRIVSALAHFVDNAGGKNLFAAEATDD